MQCCHALRKFCLLWYCKYHSCLSLELSHGSNKTNADKDDRMVSADTLPPNVVRETAPRIVMLRQSVASTELQERKVVL
jgi:hypothetical protein